MSFHAPDLSMTPQSHLSHLVHGRLIAGVVELGVTITSQFTIACIHQQELIR
jgi:hypothetical protein